MRTGSRAKAIELGIYTFGEIQPDPHTGRALSPRQRIQEVVAAAKLADESGLDVFGLGEHHSLDYAYANPAVVLAHVAGVTQRIRLISAVSVLSTNDPVRVFEDFATLDLLSGGRAEITAGRGSTVESFPLFGYDLDDYDALFAEKIELLLALGASERITWSGRFRPALQDAEIAPRPLQPQLPIWIGVGGTAQSAARAGVLGTGLSLGIIGGGWPRFQGLVDLYRRAGAQAGHPAADLRVSVTGMTHIQPNSQQAKDDYYPYIDHAFRMVARQRGGRGAAISRSDYEQLTSLPGAWFVGSPQEISEKILAQHERFGHQRFIAQIDLGGMPFTKVAETIELLATAVAPVVRRATGGDAHDEL